MTPRQKRCMIASGAAHGLLLLILVVGPAFLLPKPKPIKTTQITLVDAKRVTVAISKAAARKPAAEAAKKPPEPPPKVPKKISPPKQRPPKQKTVKRPPPEKRIPEPKKAVARPPVQVVKRKETTSNKPPREFILTPISKADVNKIYKPTSPPSAPPKPDNSKNFKDLQDALNEKQSPASETKVDTSGTGRFAMQNYFSLVLASYQRKWDLRGDSGARSGTAKTRITIHHSGRITSSTIITFSGDARFDTAVQAVLNEITKVAAFPKSARDTQRTYIINFNMSGKVSPQ